MESLLEEAAQTLDACYGRRVEPYSVKELDYFDELAIRIERSERYARGNNSTLREVRDVRLRLAKSHADIYNPNSSNHLKPLNFSLNRAGKVMIKLEEIKDAIKILELSLRMSGRIGSASGKLWAHLRLAESYALMQKAGMAISELAFAERIVQENTQIKELPSLEGLSEIGPYIRTKAMLHKGIYTPSH